MQKSIHFASYFSISYDMKILQPNIFQEWISLQEHMASLSNPQNEITLIEVINLVIKFSAHYILFGIWDDISWKKLTQKTCDKILSEAILSLSTQFQWIIHSILFSNMNLVREIDEFSHKVSYQLKMLLDFPKTVALVQEIISHRIWDIQDNYNGLDLWTGSGILLLAQYIQARRNWFHDYQIKNIGIELSNTAASFWDSFWKKLGFWHIIHWDTSDVQTLKGLWFEFLSFVSNENLPYPKACLSQEPFIENLYNLLKNWFQLSDIDGLFPQVIYYTQKPHNTQKRLNLKNKNWFLDFLDFYEEHARYIRVSSIQIWWIQKPLCEIGQDFESIFFSKSTLSSIWKRW